MNSKQSFPKSTNYQYEVNKKRSGQVVIDDRSNPLYKRTVFILYQNVYPDRLLAVLDVKTGPRDEKGCKYNNIHPNDACRSGDYGK